jgi:hypothetical protein
MPSALQEPESTRTAVGTGVYALSELRAFVAFESVPQDGHRVPMWLKTALNPVPHQPHHTDYNFADLISLFVVRQLRAEGVEPRHIREAEDYLRQKWQMDRPFVNGADIQTDGVYVWADGEIAGTPTSIENASKRGQLALFEPVRASLRHVHYRDTMACSWEPTRGVLLDPRIQFGEPVVAGTGIPTAAVAGIARRTDANTAAKRLGISRVAANRAVKFEARLAAVAAS